MLLSLKKYSANVCFVGIYSIVVKSTPASLNLITETKPGSKFKLFSIAVYIKSGTVDL